MVVNKCLGVVAVLDLLFWITPQYGWFVEPSYSYAFSRGHDQNLAVKRWASDSPAVALASKCIATATTGRR